MKKILIALFAVFFICTACNKQDEAEASANKVAATEIDSQKVYFFYAETCPHCHHAMAYIKKNHADLAFELVDVNTQNGFNLFIKCAKKFKLGERIGTPMFCMGDNYLMGWAPQYEAKFDEYVKPFEKK